MLRSVSSLTGCTWITVFYMEWTYRTSTTQFAPLGKIGCQTLVLLTTCNHFQNSTNKSRKKTFVYGFGKIKIQPLQLRVEWKRVSVSYWLRTPPVPSVAPCHGRGSSFERSPRPATLAGGKHLNVLLKTWERTQYVLDGQPIRSVQWLV